MVSPRHDIYVFEDNGELLVWPGTIAVSAGSSALSLLNLTTGTAEIRLTERDDRKKDWVLPDPSLVGPGRETNLRLNWGVSPRGVYTYEVWVNGTKARANSEPRIIFD